MLAGGRRSTGGAGMRPSVTAVRNMARYGGVSRVNVTANAYGNGGWRRQLPSNRRARASAQPKICKIVPVCPAIGPAATSFSSPRLVLPSNISVAARAERRYGVCSNANIGGGSDAGAAFEPGVGVSMIHRRAGIECRRVLVGRVRHSIFATRGKRGRGGADGRPFLRSLSREPAERERA